MELPTSRQSKRIHGLASTLGLNPIDLLLWGSNETALSTADVRLAVVQFQEGSVAVLGGDVWLETEGTYGPALVNWSVDRRGRQRWSRYVQHAAQLAEEKLAEIAERFGDRVAAVVLVVVDEDEYRELKIG